MTNIMKRILSSILFLLVCCSIINAAPASNDQTLNKSVENLKSNQVRYENQLRQVQASLDETKRQVNGLKNQNASLTHELDSVKARCSQLETTQTADKNELTGRIADTDKTVSSNQTALKNRTTWGIIITVLLLAFLATLAAIAHSMRKRIKSGSSSIDEVRKAQDALQTAQTKMQEESVKLDNKLIELAEKQISAAPQQVTGSGEVDHSLAMKVADEIVRIELNMSRMDPSIKGYKQLGKAVQRIKDNFKANGYDIIDMLGQPYNEGMKVIASLVTDESLKPGQQIITGITKPQINYNGKMIQTAQITVSQNL